MGTAATASSAATGSAGPPSIPSTSRQTLRCPHPDCQLNQYVTDTMKCRRCHRSMEIPLETIAVIGLPLPALPAPRPIDPKVLFNFELSLPFVLWRLRTVKGVSQNHLARMLGVPRTYVSKVENGHATPTIKSLEKIADKLGTDLPTIFRMCEFLANGF